MLYKYVSLARRSILEDGLIRFSQPSVFNDPFDLNPCFSLMADEDFYDLEDGSGKEGKFLPSARQDALDLMLKLWRLVFKQRREDMQGFLGLILCAQTISLDQP